MITSSDPPTSTLPSAAAPARARYTQLAHLLVLLFLGLVDTQIIAPILPELEKDFAISPATAGVAVTSYALAASLWALIVGPLSDRRGRIFFLRAAALTLTIAALLAWFANSFVVFATARVLAGFAGGTISACVIAQVADTFAYEQRGRAMGWVGAMYFVASVVGVPAGAYAAGILGWQTLFAVTAIAAILTFGLLFSKSHRSVTRTTSLLREPRLARAQLRAYLSYWRRHETRAGLLLGFSFAATAASLITYLSVWLTTTFLFTMSDIALIFLLTFSASTAGALTGGWLADRWGRQQVIIISSLALAALLPAIAATQDATQLHLLFVVGGLFLGLRQSPFQALTTELVPTSERGAYIALRNSTSQLAIALAAAAAGILYENYGFSAVSYLAAALALWAGRLSWSLSHKKPLELKALVEQ